MAIGIAIAMFIALFGWGSTYFGWSDPEGKVQLALATELHSSESSAATRPRTDAQ